MNPRRDTLTSLDTALTGIGPLAYGLATTNHSVIAVGATGTVAVATTVYFGLFVVAAIVGVVFWLFQVALAYARPRRTPANDSTAVIIGACSLFHYVTTVNLRCGAMCPLLLCILSRGYRGPRILGPRSAGHRLPVATLGTLTRTVPPTVPPNRHPSSDRCRCVAGTLRFGPWRCAAPSYSCATSSRRSLRS